MILHEEGDSSVFSYPVLRECFFNHFGHATHALFSIGKAIIQSFYAYLHTCLPNDCLIIA